MTTEGDFRGVLVARGRAQAEQAARLARGFDVGAQFWGWVHYVVAWEG